MRMVRKLEVRFGYQFHMCTIQLKQTVNAFGVTDVQFLQQKY